MSVKALNTIILVAVVAMVLVGVIGNAQSQAAQLTVVTYECRFVPEADFAKITGIVRVSGPIDPGVTVDMPCHDAFKLLLAKEFKVHRFIVKILSTGVSRPPSNMLWPDDVAILMWAVK